MKKLALLFVVVALAVGAKVYLFRPKPLKVKVYLVKRGRVESTVTGTSTGTIHAVKECSLGPEVNTVVPQMSVTVTKIHHREGAHVAQGDTILELDRKDLFAQYVVACGNVAVAESQLAQARLKADWLRHERDRMQSLWESSKGQPNSVVSDQAMDKARMDLSIGEEDVRTAQANVKQLQAQRHVVAVNLSKSWIRAPFEGVITKLSVEEGDAVAVGKPFITLMDLSKLRVHAPIDEVDIGQVKLGDPVRVTMDAWPGRTFAGSVAEISPIVTTTLEKNRTADIKAEVDNPEGLMLVGMSADVVVVTDHTDDGLYVPSTALRNGDTVLRVEGGVVRAAKVKTGLRNWETTQVTQGLAEGDAVVSLLDVEEKDEIEGREVETTAVDQGAR